MTYRNLFITMLLGGIWHGAGWNFILWGSIHGAWLTGERILKSKKEPGLLRIWTGRFLTFHVVTAAWIFFRAPSFSLASDYFSGLAALRSGTGILTPFTLILLIGGILIHYVPSRWEMVLERVINRLSALLTALFSGLYFLLLQILAPEGMAPFIYFQF